jgi:hypothetical protein
MQATIENLMSRLSFLRNPFPRDALKAGAGYLRRNPKEILSVARGAAGLRLVVPLDALRWLVDKMPSKKGPKDVVIGTAPPALSIGATSAIMGNSFRATSNIKIEDIQASTNELTVTLRVNGLKLEALGTQDSPMANLFKAMDLSKPANLLNMMPGGRPPALIDASGDRFVIDLLKVPKIASNPLVRRMLEIVTPLVQIGEVRTEDDRLIVSLRIRSGGLTQALAAFRR